MKKKLLFDDDEGFYMNQEGYVVFKEEYLLQRGYCCGNGCLHCPFEYKNVVNLSKKAQLLERRKANKSNSTSSQVKK